MTDKNNKPKPIRIGITIPDNAKLALEQALWSNGLVQNAVFLYRTFEKLPGVKCFLLGSFPLAKALKCDHTVKGPGYLDVVIEMSAKIDLKSRQAFQARGGKVVHYVPGNTMFLNMDNAVGAPVNADVPHGNYDAVWLLPHVSPSNFAYYATMYKCGMEVVPMVWSPEFMLPAANKEQEWPSYQPQKRKVVGVFEPSFSTVKTPHVPILIADRCNRLNPEQGPIIDEVRLFGTAGRVENDPGFRSFTSVLGVENRLNFTERIQAKTAFSGLACVLSHTVENGLNYNWWEALYAGYPLVHNSDIVQAGYRYKSWNIDDGADMLHNVLRKHDDPQISVAYNYAAKNWLARLAPEVAAKDYLVALQRLLGRKLG